MKSVLSSILKHYEIDRSIQQKIKESFFLESLTVKKRNYFNVFWKKPESFFKSRESCGLYKKIGIFCIALKLGYQREINSWKYNSYFLNLARKIVYVIYSKN